MKHKGLMIVALAALPFMGACANYDIAATEAMTPKGGAFNAALHKEYLILANLEKNEDD